MKHLYAMHISIRLEKPIQLGEIATVETIGLFWDMWTREVMITTAYGPLSLVQDQLSMEDRANISNATVAILGFVADHAPVN